MQISATEPDVQLLRSELTAGEWTFPEEECHGFVFLSGSGSVDVGKGKRVDFIAPCLVWVQGGRGATMRAAAGSRGGSLTVSDTGLSRAIGVGPNAQALRSALSRDLLVARLETAQARKMLGDLEAIHDERTNDWPGMEDAVRHRLALFLLEAWRLSGPVMREMQPLPRTIMHRFLHLVELHLREQWTIAQYAKAVGVTPERLNATVRRVANRSPLAIVHARLIEEAVSLLEGSSMRIADIAEELGFHDPAYFSRFFKRQTGRSPNEFRQNASLRTRNSNSFAAWP